MRRSENRELIVDEVYYIGRGRNAATARIARGEADGCSERAIAATIFGQFVSDQPFQIGTGIIGIGLWALIYGVAYFYILKEGG